MSSRLQLEHSATYRNDQRLTRFTSTASRFFFLAGVRKCCVAVAHLRPDDEPDALRCFEREPRAATRDHIEEEPGVLPELPLVAADEEISVFDREEHVARPGEKLAAHKGALPSQQPAD